MKRLIIIRPEPGAAASVAKARALGLDAVAVPLFEVRPVAWVLPAGIWAGVVVTSANAIRHGGAELEALKQLPVHAVGEVTAAAARAAGFEVATVAEGTAEDLQIRLPDARLLHLAGRDHRALAGTEAVIVYEAIKSGEPDIGTFANNVVAVHSPNAGARLAALVQDRASIGIAAISANAAAACREGWHAVAVADTTSDDAVLALAARLCQNMGQ